MKTQDGSAIGMDQRDQQLIVEQGLWRRTQNFTDEELRAKVPAGDYTQTNPVTIYTEALERKNTYMSASTGPNPFARTSGMTQPVNMTKSVQKDAGVIDFEKEKAVVAATRTMNIKNPYMENHYQTSNFEEVKAKVLTMCKTRSSNGLRGLRILFRAMDRNRNNSLEPMEFKYAMRDFGVDLTEVEIA